MKQNQRVENRSRESCKKLYRNSMLRWPLFFFVFFAVSSISAQTCPTIRVTGPSSPVVDPGEPVEFSVEISKSIPSMKIVWRVSTGEILEGQGTNKIKVYHQNRGENLTATAEVLGLPKDCPNTASETAPPFCGVTPTLIDEFSVPPFGLDKKRLEFAATEQRKNPKNRLYIIEYFKSGTSQFAIREKMRQVTKFLTHDLKFEERSFTIVAEPDSEEPRTKVYLLPPGAEKPAP